MCTCLVSFILGWQNVVCESREKEIKYLTCRSIHLFLHTTLLTLFFQPTLLTLFFRHVNRLFLALLYIATHLFAPVNCGSLRFWLQIIIRSQTMFLKRSMIELLKINHKITIHCKRAIAHTWWVLHHYVWLVTKLTHVVVDCHGMFNDVHVADESPSTLKANACDYYSIQFTVLILSNASKAMGYNLSFVEEVYLHLLVLISFMYVKYHAAAAATDPTAVGSRHGKKSKKNWRRILKWRKRQQGRFGRLPPERRKFIRYPGSLQRRRLRRQQRWKIYAVAKKGAKKLLVFGGNVIRKTSNNYYAPYFSDTTTTATPKQSNKAMRKKDVGGSHFHVGASTARRSRKKDGYRRAFGLFRFVWLFIGCCLVSVCEVRGSIPVPNGDLSSGYPGSGLRKLIFDYLAGSGTAYNNVVSTYGHIQNWDTSQVTNMQYLFYNMNSGNPDISKWNTGAVTTMFGSKSFTIDCCVFCLCQVMLFACLFVCCC
jgi:hypothetical protein